ncbi:nuclear transport factor 2 family protein [Rhodococcus sp. KBS0724]|uniref:nuclear transport factor 2 family protein n=1 Tax=Rhodococcus sp. KBS0724 TaxID=1179674 RepID=UPI00110F0724|nr:nuclear transport factor 2 family protein [Rhodococcus sp. KBS0724]TSD40207.1 nuclear transport factor 2 family protein [Rhodococcus sp. KBS0724]
MDRNLMSTSSTGAPLSPSELATRIVQAAGHPERMIENLAPDVTWWITPSIPAEVMESFTSGRGEVLANLHRVFGDLYDPNKMTVEVHHAITDGNIGAVRFKMSGEFSTGGFYENEYSLWLEAIDGWVVRVWEYVDMAHTTAQIRSATSDR